MQEQKKAILGMGLILSFLEGVFFSGSGSGPALDILSQLAVLALVYAWLHYDCIDRGHRISKLEIILLLFPTMMPIVIATHLLRTRRGEIPFALLEAAFYGIMMILIGNLGYLVSFAPTVLSN